MSHSTLIVHRGARIVERPELDCVEPPQSTNTWVPIKHSVVLDEVGRSLSEAGFTIRTVKTALSRGDQRLFATLDTACDLAGNQVTLAVAVVNSNDRSLPMKFIAGSRVMICDNLALRSDLMAAVVRRHTRFGLERFREALSQAVMSLGQFQQSESARIQRAMLTEIDDVLAESVMLRAYEQGIVPARMLPRLIGEWRQPSFDYGCPAKSLWTLEQAHTTVLSGLARSNPQRFCSASLSLHGLLERALVLRPIPDEPGER